MSTIRKLTDLRRRSPTDDPYFYGFRYVERRGVDGKKHVVVEPLTEYDVLHPQEGDHISQNDAHNRDCRHLMDVAEMRLAGRPGTVPLSDCLIDLDLVDVDPLAPDLAVLEGVRVHRRWSLFSVREERARWLLVGEVTSPSTRDNDLSVKPHYYWQAGIPFYFIVDEVAVHGEVRELRLLAFTRGRRTWRRVRPNAQGRIWLEALGIWLGIEGGRVACYDEAGRRIEDYTEMAQARQAAEAARATEEAARIAAEEQIQQLQEELRRLREKP